MDSIGKVASKLSSGPSSNSRNTAKHQQMANLAARLFDFYPPQEFGSDPRIFLAGVVELFEAYPAEVVQKAVSVVYGIPSRFKFVPRIAEIKEVLEELMGPVRREEERARIQFEREHSLPAPIDRSQRPSYEELQARCAADGLMIGRRQKLRENPAKAAKEFCEQNNVSPEQWNAIPNSK